MVRPTPNPAGNFIDLPFDSFTGYIFDRIGISSL